ncbi:hypothetical protein ACQP00_38310 [Dactylosporangium sp. CS-047395]|uniref:hypothetical protein n=1 Tax=Dactylosporangium sp. CS-047395 TaxID=3239936 RepID=UPI003D8C7042
MHSFYLLRHTAMANNSDALTDCYVLADRDALIRVLTGLDVDPRWTVACTLEVHDPDRRTIDLLATLPDEEIAADDPDYRTLDLDAIDLPALTGPPLPPGHPVIVDGEALHYGCTAFYN